MTVIIGIDPGYSGAVAFLWPNMKLEIHDMPVLKNAKGKTELNMHILHDLLTPEGDEPHMAFIEQVAAMRGQGVKDDGRAEAALIALYGKEATNG
jgi:hypothetical protein